MRPLCTPTTPTENMYTENTTITNLYAYLKRTKHNDIRVRTTRCRGGWHDNEFDANAAGFDISCYYDPEYEAKHQFAECYRLIRRK